MKIAVLDDRKNEDINNQSLNRIDEYHDDVNEAISQALRALGHNVYLLEANINLERRLSVIRPDLVFNNSIKQINGGEKAYGPSILEKLRIPFTGSSSSVCADAYDKVKAKKIFIRKNINTPNFYEIPNALNKIPVDIKFPLLLKPVFGGCSRGIGKENLIREKNTYMRKIKKIIDKFPLRYFVEEFIGGREFTISVIGNLKNLKVLPIMEFIYPNEDEMMHYRDFKTKMIDYEKEKYICPATLSKPKQFQLTNLAIKTYQAIGCRDYARIDIRLDKEGKPYVLELNVLPNLIPNQSSFAITAEAGGLSFTQLISTIIFVAKKRLNL